MRLRNLCFVSTIVSISIIGTAHAQTVFFDDFNGPTLAAAYSSRRYIPPDLPNTNWRWAAPTLIANYLGTPTYNFETVDGATVLRIHSDFVNENARWGWRVLNVYPSIAPIRLEARVNTMVQSRLTGFDELFELWILDATDVDRYVKVALSAPNYGVDRVFTADSSVTSTGIDTPFPFTDNTWYRFVITGSPIQEVRLSIYDDTDTNELIGFSAGHTLAAFASGFTIGLSQSIGLPGTTYPNPTDAALDWIRLDSDTTPPVISGMPASGCTIWPPNHNLVQVASVTATDADSGIAPGSFKVTGTSNEPIDPSDPSIVITPTGSGGFIVQLQADRLGTGTGRIYTLTARASDLAGNTATVTATCTVPHDQGE